jgi:hypothetical protein
LNVRKQVPARVVIRHHVQLPLGLKGEVHEHNERVLHFVQDVAFRLNRMENSMTGTIGATQRQPTTTNDNDSSEKN